MHQFNSIQGGEHATIVVGLTSEKRYTGAPLGKKDGYGLKTDGKLLSPENPAGFIKRTYQLSAEAGH